MSEIDKHPHYEMIVAKAANMDLVVFSKNQSTGLWATVNDQRCTDFGELSEYFLCLPQHKEACLHWLNGGSILVKYANEEERGFLGSVPNTVLRLSRGRECWFIKDCVSFRIKPKKEKRWIAYNSKNEHTTCARKTKAEIINEYEPCDQWQFIEIEVEV